MPSKSLYVTVVQNPCTPSVYAYGAWKCSVTMCCHPLKLRKEHSHWRCVNDHLCLFNSWMYKDNCGNGIRKAD
jgi:hypothetical protein